MVKRFSMNKVYLVIGIVITDLSVVVDTIPYLS